MSRRIVEPSGDSVSVGRYYLSPCLSLFLQADCAHRCSSREGCGSLVLDTWDQSLACLSLVSCSR